MYILLATTAGQKQRTHSYKIDGHGSVNNHLLGFIVLVPPETVSHVYKVVYSQDIGVEKRNFVCHPLYSSSLPLQSRCPQYPLYKDGRKNGKFLCSCSFSHFGGYIFGVFIHSLITAFSVTFF